MDGGEALVGTSPASQCQAVVSGNSGLVLALRLALIGREAERDLAAVGPAAPAAADDGREAAWLDWEARKQDRLRRLAQDGRVA